MASPHSGIPLARYRLSFRPRDDSSLRSPQTGYLGSAWHGAFGHALKDVVCVTKLPQCEPCHLLPSCPYPKVFMNRPAPNAQRLRLYTRTPQPHVLQPADTRADSNTEHLNLGVILFGNANRHFPEVIQALKMAGQRGLTARRVTLELSDVQAENLASLAPSGNDAHNWTPIDSTSQLPRPAPLALPPQPPALDTVDVLQVKLISALRIKENGHYVRAENFRFRAFMANTLRRISLLAHFFGETELNIDFKALLQQAEQVPLESHNLHWQEIARYSSRQKQKLQMGGLVGEFRLSSAKIEPFWPWLWLGQWTHVGKLTTMGLGRYLLRPAAHPAPPWPTPGKL